MDSFDFTFLIEILRLIILLALKKKKKNSKVSHGKDFLIWDSRKLGYNWSKIQ